MVVFIVLLILVTACSQTSQKMVQIREKAVSSGNSNYCDSIEDDGFKKGCYKDVAVKTNNPSLCLNTNDKDQCYLSVVKEFIVCDNIINSETKDQCIWKVGGITKDISACEKVTAKNKDYCIMMVTSSTKDLSACELIVDNDIKNSCYRYSKS